MRNPPIIHPILFALFPVLSLYAENVFITPFTELVTPTALIVACTVVAWVCLALILKSWDKAALIVSVTLLLLFSYGHFINPYTGESILGYWVEEQKYTVLGTVLILVVSSYAIVRAGPRLNQVTAFFNVMSVVAVLLPCATAAYAIASDRLWTPVETGRATEGSAREDTTKIVSSKPNIFYIVLDTYPSRAVLKECYDYSNDDFLSKLEQKGFYIADRSLSNYSTTSQSLSCSLNLTYLDDVARKMGPDSRNKMVLISMIRDSYVRRFLKKQGYTYAFFNSGSMWTDTPDADLYITQSTSLTHFENALVGITPIPRIAEQLKVLRIMSGYEQHRSLILFTLEELPSMADTSTPVFVFAHLLIPHVPFIFGENGERVNQDKDATQEESVWLRDRAAYKEGYRKQVTFLNKKLLEVVDAILHKSRIPPIIIIQGDHGPSVTPWDRYDDALREKFGILNAYYLPGNGKKDLYEEISPVNTFRLVFNEYFGANFELLQDRSYFNDWHHPYATEEVTSRIRSHRGPPGEAPVQHRE